MRKAWRPRSGILVISVLIVLASGCVGGGGSDVVLDEHDGEELTELMRGVQIAVQNEDQTRFESLLPSRTNPKSMDVANLEPYVTAYRVNSMPRNCTKLKMTMDFTDPGVPDHVARFTLSWSASYVMQKWLTEYLVVERIEFKS
jgi:hypothetical protein